MEEPDQELHAAQQLRRAERPAFVEHQVVAILQAHPEELAKNVQFVERLLDVDQVDSPRPLLPLDDFLQSIRGTPVTSAGVEIKQVDFLHRVVEYRFVGQPIMAAAAFRGGSAVATETDMVDAKPRLLSLSKRPPEKAAAAMIGCPTLNPQICFPGFQRVIDDRTIARPVRHLPKP